MIDCIDDGDARTITVNNVLFNDALNTFYLRLYGVRHMVKNHSDSERGNPLPSNRHEYIFHGLCCTNGNEVYKNT